MRILIVEDEPKMVDLLRDGLREHGHTVMTAQDGADGLALACEHDFDVIVLDLMLPKLTGWEVMRDLRNRENCASVLVLTACDAEFQVIEGLESGADDYLTKPFSFPELLARIKCLARAKKVEPGLTVTLDTLVIDTSRHVAFRAGQNLGLTRTEFAILDRLIRTPGSIVTRASLVQSVWGDESSVGRSALDSFISLLRKKVDPPGQKRLMHTVKGVGYRVQIEPDCPVQCKGEPN